MSYRSLEIWRLAKGIVVDIHMMTLQELPKFEMYETGSQIRRSSKSIKANIVEGYGRRIYKADFLKFLIYAHSSVDETIDHLETLFETGSLKNEQRYQDILTRLNSLGKMINGFIRSVQKNHTPPKH